MNNNPDKEKGILELAELLSSMSPELQDGEFVFCTVDGVIGNYINLNPLAAFIEQEGLTLVLSKTIAQKAQLNFDSTFKQITLTVHSSLDAVGLTAAVSTKLTEHGISANVVAAYYHDHIFVPSDKAQAALSALEEFSA